MGAWKNVRVSVSHTSYFRRFLTTTTKPWKAQKRSLLPCGPSPEVQNTDIIQSHFRFMQRREALLRENSAMSTLNSLLWTHSPKIQWRNSMNFPKPSIFSSLKWQLTMASKDFPRTSSRDWQILFICNGKIHFYLAKQLILTSLLQI